MEEVSLKGGQKPTRGAGDQVREAYRHLMKDASSEPNEPEIPVTSLAPTHESEPVFVRLAEWRESRINSALNTRVEHPRYNPSWAKIAESLERQRYLDAQQFIDLVGNSNNELGPPSNPTAKRNITSETCAHGPSGHDDHVPLDARTLKIGSLSRSQARSHRKKAREAAFYAPIVGQHGWTGKEAPVSKGREGAHQLDGATRAPTKQHAGQRQVQRQKSILQFFAHKKCARQGHETQGETSEDGDQRQQVLPSPPSSSPMCHDDTSRTPSHEPPAPNEPFRMATWNVMGLTTVSEELKTIVLDHNPDVIILTKT